MTPVLIEDNDVVGIKLAGGEEAEAIAAVIEDTSPEARIERYPAYISIEAPRRLTVEMSAIAQFLGRAYGVPDFLVTLSSYHGRVAVDDDRVTLTSEIDASKERR